MKIWPSIYILLFFVGGALATDPGPYTVEWLQRGMASSVFCSTPGVKVSPQQEQWAVDAIFYYQGFISGLNMATMLDSGKGAGSPLFYPDDEMDTCAVAAPSVLEFIRLNKDRIKPGAPSQRVLLAWYLMTHSKSTGINYVVASTILDSKEPLKRVGERLQTEKEAVAGRTAELQKMRDAYFRSNKPGTTPPVEEP